MQLGSGLARLAWVHKLASTALRWSCLGGWCRLAIAIETQRSTVSRPRPRALKRKLRPGCVRKRLHVLRSSEGAVIARIGAALCRSAENVTAMHLL